MRNKFRKAISEYFRRNIRKPRKYVMVTTAIPYFTTQTEGFVDTITYFLVISDDIFYN